MHGAAHTPVGHGERPDYGWMDCGACQGTRDPLLAHLAYVGPNGALAQIAIGPCEARLNGLRLVVPKAEQCIDGRVERTGQPERHVGRGRSRSVLDSGVSLSADACGFREHGLAKPSACPGIG